MWVVKVQLHFFLISLLDEGGCLAHVPFVLCEENM